MMIENYQFAIKQTLKPWLILFLVVSLLTPTSLTANDPGTYEEIPYYLKQLNGTSSENKIFELNKRIHDILVTTDLSKKRNVKKLDPIVDEIRKAMDSGFDRTNVTGQTKWLASAVHYYDQERLKPVVDIPLSDWLAPQTENKLGMKISTYPDKILLHSKGENDILLEGSNIHEAVLSPNGKWVAFFTRPEKDKPNAEIWTIRLKDKETKKIADVASCQTLLFSLSGKKIFFQEALPSIDSPSKIYWMSARGGTPKRLVEGMLLNTVVGTGRHKGHLIIDQKYTHHLGANDPNCPNAYSESGKHVGRLIQAPCQ